MQTPHHHNDMLLLVHDMMISSCATDRLQHQAAAGDEETTHITNRHTGRKLRPATRKTCCGTRSQTTRGNTATLNPLRSMAAKRNLPCRKNKLLPVRTRAVHQLLQPAKPTNTPACAPNNPPSHDKTSCLPTPTHGRCTALLHCTAAPPPQTPPPHLHTSACPLSTCPPCGGVQAGHHWASKTLPLSWSHALSGGAQGRTHPPSVPGPCGGVQGGRLTRQPECCALIWPGDLHAATQSTGHTVTWRAPPARPTD